MTPDTILHIARSDYAMMITEVGDNQGFTAFHTSSRPFTAAMKAMGWKEGEGWCNYWANSVWWRAFAPSFPDELLPILRRALDEFLVEKDSVGLWQTKEYLAPLRALGMNAIPLRTIYGFISVPIFVTDTRGFGHRESKFLPLIDYANLAMPGSLVMFSCATDDDNERGTEDHIGILVKASEKGIVCIEGNAGDALRMTYREWNTEIIRGWITPPRDLPVWNNYVLPTT